MRIKSISLLLGMMLMATSALAADYPKAIQGAVKAGLKVVADFDTPAGLKGWVMQQGTQYSIVYTTADGKFLMTGVMVDEDGKNLSAEYAQKYIPKPDYTAAYKELDSAVFFTEGAKDDKNMIYVFFDPNCIFCHMFWKAVQPYEKAGLQVRWIPVAFLKKDSAAKAVALMTAKDPAASMAINMSKFNKDDESGGIDAAVNPSEELLEKIRANGVLMDKFSSSGTPTIAWKDKDGKVNAVSGFPRLSALPAMTGLPEQKIDDPDFARFK